MEKKTSICEGCGKTLHYLPFTRNGYQGQEYTSWEWERHDPKDCITYLRKRLESVEAQLRAY